VLEELGGTKGLAVLVAGTCLDDDSDRRLGGKVFIGGDLAVFFFFFLWGLS